MTEIVKKPQGFACLSPEKRREIASRGGKSVKAENRAYSRDPDLARRAGLKGGLAQHASRGGNPIVETKEVWGGAMIAKIQRLALAGKTLVETRDEVKSVLTIPAFREKCRRFGAVFVRTRPK